MSKIKNSLYTSHAYRIPKFFLKRGIFLIAYHSISADTNNEAFGGKIYPHLSVHEKSFRDQLNFLKQEGHTFITVSEIESAVQRGLSKPTVIYFDDGFRDVLVNAAPIMRELGVPGTAFITTDFIERKALPWSFIVRFVLQQRGVVEDEIKKTIKGMKRLSREAREAALVPFEITKTTAEIHAAHRMFMTWDEVRELQKSNFEIGSHTVTHPKLTDLSVERLRDELIQSKERIEREIGKSVVALSYPHARYNEQVMQEVAAAGYTKAVGSLVGVNSASHTHARSLELKQIAPDPTDTIVDFMYDLYVRGIRGMIS